MNDAKTGIETATVVTTVENAPASKMETLDSLKGQLAAACTSGNDADVMRLSKLILKSKSDVEKAEGEKLKAEAESLAGDRETAETTIGKTIRKEHPEWTTALLAVKAKGFTYTVDHRENEKGQLDSTGAVKVTGGCVLIVPAVKKTGGGGGGGSTGALKQQTGLSRHELIDQYATSEEKADISTAEEGATSRKDSARYGAEKPVIKRILADNPQLIKR